MTSPNLETETQNSQVFSYEALGTNQKPCVIWAHGWGQNRQSLKPLAQGLGGFAHHYVIDFPGFGESPLPPDSWGTAEYADAAAKFIQSCTDGPIIWAGHSFGCRVGIQLAARHPHLIAGLILIAGAGLKRRRPPLKRLSIWLRVRLFKVLKHMIRHEGLRQTMLRRFASPDYLNAGPLRSVFVRVVNEDLSEQAKQISCPTLLIYGKNDTETPPEIGERLNRLIPGSEIVILDRLDHYSILTAGQHQVMAMIRDFINQVHTTDRHH